MTNDYQEQGKITVRQGSGNTKFGPGVSITLDSDAVALAVDHWLHAQGVVVRGPRTVRIDGDVLDGRSAEVYVDPSGFVIHHGKRYDGRGANTSPPLFHESLSMLRACVVTAKNLDHKELAHTLRWCLENLEAER